MGRPAGEAIGLSPLSDLLLGTGTGSDPFLIFTAEELNMVGLFPCEWDKHFRLMADIDLSGFDGKEGRPALNIIAPDELSWYGYLMETPFTGIFDGNGHRIWHLTVAVKDRECGGLIGGLGRGAEVKDLGVVDVNITGSGHCVGGLLGFNEGNVTNCYSTGTVTGGGSVGGLVGWDNYGNIALSYSTGTVTATGNDVGGLVGYNIGGTVTHCYSTSAVSGNGTVGGLIGGTR